MSRLLCSGPASSPITTCGISRFQPCGQPAGALLRWTRQAMARALVQDVGSRWTSAPRRDKPQIGENIASRFRSWNRRTVIKTVRSVLVARDGVLDALPNVTAPALIVSGAEDTILPSAMSRRIVAKLPNARHVEVPGAAHLVPLERPEAANALILDFIKN